MKKIREILRLRWACGQSHHVIAQSLGMSSSTVSDCVRRAHQAQLGWPLADDMDDEQLELLLYRPGRKTKKACEAISWPRIHQELMRRKQVTLLLLWHEYKEQYPAGISYSQFCYLYRQWQKHLDVWMRQPHPAGEKLFVDYAGQTVPVLADVQSGEMREAQIFVAVLGASNFTYVEATWTQTLPDWIGSHGRTFDFLQGVPAIVVPDNLKSGVHKAHLYEPEINPSYREMAAHYGVVIVPTRSAAPRDKAKVENAVLQTERCILAPLRDRTFFNLVELNQAIRPLLQALNQRPFQKLPGSRQSQFMEVEKSALKPLPAIRYVFAEWQTLKAGMDYHVKVDDHYYSVPFVMVKKELYARYTQATVEIFYKNRRIASHQRSGIKGSYTTLSEHMPKHHQYQAEWTPERLVRWAEKTGPSTGQLIEKILGARRYPQQVFRSCLGILRLGKRYGADRLEAACRRALHVGAHSYKSVESILKNGLDTKPLREGHPEERVTSRIPAAHEYIRGHQYFNPADEEDNPC